MSSAKLASQTVAAAQLRVEGAAAVPAIVRFPVFPSRADLMNPRHLHDPGHQPALRRRLRGSGA